MILTCAADGSFHIVGCKCVSARKPPETGWICPKCYRGLAPWVAHCDCTGGFFSNSTINTTPRDAGEREV